MILIKTEAELSLMRESGKILHEVLEALAQKSKPGVALIELDEYAAQMIGGFSDAESAFKGFHGFPAHICTCLNDEVVHGIPDRRVLQEGDILGIDMGITYKGYITDSARTIGIGQISPEASLFLSVNKDTLDEVLGMMKAGIYVGDIGAFVSQKIHDAGYSVIHELTGHGVGQFLHEDPYIPNIGVKGTGTMLKAGMTLAIEPIIAMGKRYIITDPDGWMIRTKDGSLASQFEHTIIVHEDRVEVIT